jgi:hypothetical protein
VGCVLAGAAGVLAAGWLAERITLVPGDPFGAVTAALVGHPVAASGGPPNPGRCKARCV